MCAQWVAKDPSLLQEDSADSDQTGRMHSVKLSYLVCAVTVHLLLFLFECHGNKEYVLALACVHACVRTYLYV